MRPTPRCCSICWMAWLAADWETKCSSAAREKLRSRTTSQKSRRLSSCTGRSYHQQSLFSLLNFSAMTNAGLARTLTQLPQEQESAAMNAPSTHAPPMFAGQRPAEGLYDPRHEHDACGVGFVVDIKGRKSHAIVRQALAVL